MKQPDACIVRITDAQGNTLGTGFLVSADGLVATCAHVVKGTEPRVAFPGGEPRPTQVVNADEVHDVVVLRMEGELPPGAALAHLGRSTDGYYSDFRSRGYRPMGGLEGIPAEGRVLDAVSEAPGYPDVRYMPLILQTQHTRGGMSGAPVYVPDLDLVVGMITGFWDSLIAKTGFSDRDTVLATSAEAIVAACSDIRLWEPRLSRTATSQRKVIRVFVASPSDVRQERDRIHQVVIELNQPGGIADQYSCVFQVLDWRDAVPGMGRPEEVILEQLPLERWDIFVGILWTRFGTPSGGKDPITGRFYDSGTEEEFWRAYQAWQQTGRPRLLVYRRIAPTSLDAIEPNQLAKVQAFWRQFGAAGEHPGLYRSYQTPDEFERQVRSDMTRLLPELTSSY